MKIVKESLSDKLKGPTKEDILRKIYAKEPEEVTSYMIRTIYDQYGEEELEKLLKNKEINPFAIEAFLEELIFSKHPIREEAFKYYMESKINDKITELIINLAFHVFSLEEVKKLSYKKEFIKEFEPFSLVHQFLKYHRSQKEKQEFYDWLMDLIKKYSEEFHINISKVFIMKLIDNKRFEDIKWLERNGMISDNIKEYFQRQNYDLFK